MDRDGKSPSNNADEWEEAENPSGVELSDREDFSPSSSYDRENDEIATAVFPDLPDVEGVIGKKESSAPHPAESDLDVSNAEGTASDQVSDLAELQSLPKFTERDSKARAVDGEARTTRGDESVVEAETTLSAATEEKKIPDDFFYDYDDLVSKPVIEPEFGLPKNLLQLFHSFGYDCTRRANLQVVDHGTVVFIAGNYVVILNLKEQLQTYIRSTGGRGMGAIAVHPSKKYIAAGEIGERPNLNIYEYPSLQLYRILKAGAEKSYTSLDFSLNGSLLASVGGEPDYMLTLWNWRQEKIVLRCKAFSQDVFRATFSAELPGQLTSSGVGHIRFWKMARTFTGLKLQGSLGRFGKREISDIDGYVELPDGKVLSGCESGNMLLWEDGLCINEIMRRGKRPCHQGPIQQIIMDEGELITVGVDGYVRVWDFETTGNMQADESEKSMELEPVNELRVGTDAQLTFMVRSRASREFREASFWYAQDANGGIWRLDLSFQFTSLQPERCMYYHSGPIFGVGVSPVAHLVASAGNDGTVRIYDVVNKKLIAIAKFNSPATSLLWLPKKVDKDGATMLAGFNDGVIRLLCLQENLLAEVRKLDLKYELCLVFAVKPHKSTVTCLEIDNAAELLITGSSDGTIFFFDVSVDYAPIGFVHLSSSVNYLHLSPVEFSQPTVLVSCADGKVYEVEAPIKSACDTTKSYNLTQLKTKQFNFRSIKSKLRREEMLLRLAEEEKERKRLARQERQILVEKGLLSQDEANAADEEEEAADEKKPKEGDKWEPVFPDKPSPVLFAVYGTREGNFWASMGDFDAGYFYECQFRETSSEEKEPTYDKPIRAIPIAGSDDVPVTHMILNKNRKFAIMGMQNGSIRIQQLSEKGNFATFGAYWIFGVHDANYGEITQLYLSHDETFLFSVGLDGNFFIFLFDSPSAFVSQLAGSAADYLSQKDAQSAKDIDDAKALSIEDDKQKRENENMLMLAEKKKEIIRLNIETMKETFNEFHKRNDALPSYLKLNKKELDMDPTFAKAIMDEKNEKINRLNKEMIWNEEKLRISLEKLKSTYKDITESEKTYIRAFNSPHVLANFRLARRSRYLKECLDNLRKNREEMLLRERNKMLLAKPAGLNEETKPETAETKDLKLITRLKGSLGERLVKAAAKIEEAKKKRELRQAQWKEFLDSRLPDDYEDPNEVAAIQEAKTHMGDFKLKSASDYVVAQRVNTKSAREKVIMHKLYLYEYKHNFNTRFMALRNKKVRIINRIRNGSAQLQRIHQHIPRRQAKAGPTVPTQYPEEFPERRYEYTKSSLQQWHEAYMARKASETGQAQAGSPMIHIGQPMAAPTGGAEFASAGESDSFGATGGRRSVGHHDQSGASKQELSEIEKLMKRDDEIRLIFDQDVIIRNMNDMLRNFDAELRCLRHDKFLLDISMKNAEARELILFLELILLKELEKEEDVIVAKVDSKIAESNETQSKILDIQGKIEARRKEIEYLQGQEKILNDAFLTTIGDNKFASFLGKVFRKRIRRARRKQFETPGADDDSDSGDSDDDMSEYSDAEGDESEDDEERLDLDVCPAGCDLNLYENVCSLREDRVDIEEAMTNERKTRDNLIKELEIAVKNAQKIEVSLDAAEKDLEDFQLTKQKGLNAIEVTVTFKLHQLEYLRENGSFIMDFRQSLAFEDSKLVLLQKRIKELQQEQVKQRKQKKESKLLHITLTRDRRLYNRQIESAKDKCDTMMAKKFGRLVDLEKLETIAVYGDLEELRQKLHDCQEESEMELAHWQNKLSLHQCKKREFLKRNTVLTEYLAKMKKDGEFYEQALNNRQRNVGMEQMDDYTGEILEHQQLTQLLKTQVDELDKIKREIWALSKK